MQKGYICMKIITAVLSLILMKKCVLGHQKNGCLPTKLLTSEQTIVVKMTKIETTGMHGYRAVFPVVNNANIYQYLVYL